MRVRACPSAASGIDARLAVQVKFKVPKPLNRAKSKVSLLGAASSVAKIGSAFGAAAAGSQTRQPSLIPAVSGNPAGAGVRHPSVSMGSLTR
jgi:hypothetical protein